MAYERFGLVQASDYNSIISTLNTMWGVGSGSIGYGQSTTLSSALTNNKVLSEDWKKVYRRLYDISDHGGFDYIIQSTLSSYPRSITDKIAYISQYGPPFPSNYISTNWLPRTGWALEQSFGEEIRGDYTPIWRTSAQLVFTATWASPDQARYFFNCGGQIRFDLGLRGASIIGDPWTTIPYQAGYVFLSQTAPITYPSIRLNSGQIFNGITNQTQINNNPIQPTINDQGYYQLQTSDVEVFNQRYGFGSRPNSNIGISIRTNGPSGSNGDNGNILTFTINYTSVPPIPVGRPGVSGTYSKIRVIYPKAQKLYFDNLENTWGTVTLAFVGATGS